MNCKVNNKLKVALVNCNLLASVNCYYYLANDSPFFEEIRDLKVLIIGKCNKRN